MPDMATRPKDWNECVQNGKFIIINGQHSIQASKKICENVENYPDPELRMKLQKWDCHVVWSNNEDQLLSLSAKYNETNVIGQFVSSLSKTLAHCRELWVSHGKPEKVRVNTVPDSVDEITNKKQLDLFRNAVTSAYTSHLNKVDQNVFLLGEKSIIVSKDSTWYKWKKVFRHHEDGTLFDPQTGLFLKDVPKAGNRKEANVYDYDPLTSGRLRCLFHLEEASVAECAEHILEEPQPRIWIAKAPSTYHYSRSIKDWCD